MVLSLDSPVYVLFKIEISIIQVNGHLSLTCGHQSDCSEITEPVVYL